MAAAPQTLSGLAPTGRAEIARRTSVASYAVAVAALGALLLTRELVYVWAPLPRSVPSRDLLASAAGAVMLISALALLWRKTATPSSAVLGALFLSWLLLVQLPRILAKPSQEILWSGAAQLTSLAAGGWLLFALFASPTRGLGRWLGGDRGARMARLMYAAALPMFGLHHFLTSGAADVVPAWLPFRPGWVYLTGVAHIAAGVAILVGIVPRLAATLEAIMIGAFVLLVHVPGVIDAPRDRLQWTMLIVAATIGGAASVVACSTPGGAPRKGGAVSRHSLEASLKAPDA